MQEFWISKYALSKGIFSVRAKMSTSVDDMIVAPPTAEYRLPQRFQGEGRDWHRTRPEAEARAEVVRRLRVASLRAQIAKLEALKFTPNDVQVETER